VIWQRVAWVLAIVVLFLALGYVIRVMDRKK